MNPIVIFVLVMCFFIHKSEKKPRIAAGLGVFTLIIVVLHFLLS
jgi:heme/copper-type cytochrome/quinol oxidase subunit 4